MRIPCTNCKAPSVVIGRPKNLENIVETNEGIEQIGRIYLVCKECGWTGHADWITRMKAPDPKELEQKPYFQIDLRSRAVASGKN